MRVLVTGGAGYIGSHFVDLLLDNDIQTVVLDDLSAGHRGVVPDEVPFIQADMGDRDAVRAALREHRPTAVVHFAGLIQVGESVEHPDRYYQTNLVKTLSLLDEAVRRGVRHFVFSSTAAVYGDPQTMPIGEEHPRKPINAYGASKLGVEMALADFSRAFGIGTAALRYFNAAGAHPSGRLAERHEPETHLIPLAIDAALGRRPEVTVYGDDWQTPDGTCVRDYVHVMDLVEAHLLALGALERGMGTFALNLGTGQGVSVRQVIDCVQRVTGQPVPHKVGPHRAGDPPQLVAAVHRASQLLGWQAKRPSIDQMVEDALRARKSSFKR